MTDAASRPATSVQGARIDPRDLTYADMGARLRILGPHFSNASGALFDRSNTVLMRVIHEDEIRGPGTFLGLAREEELEDPGGWSWRRLQSVGVFIPDSRDDDLGTEWSVEVIEPAPSPLFDIPDGAAAWMTGHDRRGLGLTRIEHDASYEVVQIARPGPRGPGVPPLYLTPQRDWPADRLHPDEQWNRDYGRSWRVGLSDPAVTAQDIASRPD